MKPVEGGQKPVGTNNNSNNKAVPQAILAVDTFAVN